MATTDDAVITWRKSSFSTGNGGACVEVGWRTSSFSSGNGGNCVEVGLAGRAVLVRDTKNRTGPTLTLTPAAWHALTTTLRP